MKKEKPYLANGNPNPKYWTNACYMTVGDLKKFIKKHNLKDDALILYHRIEDVYFDKYKWGESSVKKKSWFHDDMKDEFVVSFGCIKHKDDPNLYLTAHY